MSGLRGIERFLKGGGGGKGKEGGPPVLGVWAPAKSEKTRVRSVCGGTYLHSKEEELGRC